MTIDQIDPTFGTPIRGVGHVYCVHGGFVFSSRHVWRPGSFATLKALRMCVRWDDSDIQRLQDSVSPRHITEDDVRGFKR